MRSATILAAFAATALFAAGPARAADDKPAPTFSKDVAPILYKACVDCHRPTMFAPMSLMTYDEARPWARSIKQRVVARAMPPWGADAPHGVFKNDPSLTQNEIDTIAAWVDAGAPPNGAAPNDSAMVTNPSATARFIVSPAAMTSS